MSKHDYDDLTEGLFSIGNALQELGTAGADTRMGALELVAFEIKEGSARVAEALLEIAAALKERT